jgi:hypothetical protein
MKAHRGTRPHAEPTSERLAQALEQAGTPGWMIAKARVKAYDDYQGDSATPIVDLVRDCEANGLSALAQRAKDGAFQTASKFCLHRWELKPTLLDQCNSSNLKALILAH